MRPGPSEPPAPGDTAAGAAPGAAAVLDAPLRVGDLVICASPRFRQEVGLGLDVGMYIVGRSRDVQVLFAGVDRSLWIPTRMLRRVDPSDARVVAPPAWVVRLHRATRLLEAVDLDLEREDDGFVARIGSSGLDLERLRALEALVGEDAKHLEIRPGSMARLLVVLPVGREER